MQRLGAPEPPTAPSGPPDAAEEPRSIPKRQPQKFTVPAALMELLHGYHYSREDLLTRALDLLYDRGMDRQLLRPIFPSEAGQRRPKISISTTPETRARIGRIAGQNDWNASQTVTALLWHLLSDDDARDALTRS